MEPRQGIQIPFDQLPAETLRSVVEEIVTRDGTESTESAKKVEQVRELLRRGHVELWYDATTGTCSIVRHVP